MYKLTVLFMFLSCSVFGQWTETKPVTVESLTKNCIIVDSTGAIVIYKNNKPDKNGDDYFFKIVTVVDKNNQKKLTRKRVYRTTN